MSSLAQLQDELAIQHELLNASNEMLGFAPDDQDTLETKALAEAEIASLNVRIAALQPSHAAAASPPSHTDDAPAPAPKYDMSKHPKFRKVSPEATPTPASEESQAPQIFSVKDTVWAKWSEDKQWYHAVVISKTGSSNDPVYTVNFKGYNSTETKRKFEVRPIENPKKRKAESGTAAPSTPLTSTTPIPPPPPSNNSAIISAAPSVDPDRLQRKEPSKVSDGPTRMAPEPKKLKGNRALDKAKTSWNAWQASGPKEAPTTGGTGVMKKKESQFRTPDLPGAKVGFTGSGKPMQKDQQRAKWNYGGDDD